MLRKCKENVKMLRKCKIWAAQDTFIGDTKASMGLPPKTWNTTIAVTATIFIPFKPIHERGGFA